MLIPVSRAGIALCLVGLGWAGATPAPLNAQAWRLNDAAGLPDWLSISGETRARYESLTGQFRANGSGGDQLLLFRTLVATEARSGPLGLTLEIQDSRTYQSRAGTPLSNSIANPFDALQLHADVSFDGFIGSGGESRLQIGRQTVSIGSKRQIERVDFANVIKSYTGAQLRSTNQRGDELHAILVTPVRRDPRDRAELVSNDIDLDREEWHRRIWGVHFIRADLGGASVPDLQGELFAYGLLESDRATAPTPNRRYTTPGFRLFRPAEVGRWDTDIEGAYRFGSRRASSDPAATENLDVSATMLFAAVGYTFDVSWSPRLAAEFYWASGDSDPADGTYGQYERLFGSRRTDLNNTSIHGPLTPANLSAPGIRLELKPSPRGDGRIAYSAASLASETDSWVIAKLRDTSGRSGSFLGHTFDGRARVWVVPDLVQVEVGGSAFLFGDFPKAVEGGPTGERTVFGYVQTTLRF